MRIVLTGGGTGGHLMPFGPLVDSLRRTFAESQTQLPKRLIPQYLEIDFVGVVNEYARAFFAERGVATYHVPSGKLRRYASGLTVLDLLFRLPIGVLLGLIRLYVLMPDVVISLGGYGSIPTVLAAAFFRIPILIHELDAVPGLANRKLFSRASAITVGFATAIGKLGKGKYKATATGTPVRDDLHRLSRSEARRSFGIDDQERVLLVMGGSQGAKQINEIVLHILPQLILEVTVIHLTGKENFQAVSTVAGELLAQSSRKEKYLPFPYLGEKMALALVACDCLVSRAGANSLAEIATLRKPSLIIPLDGSAQDHQRANAQVFEAAGAALVLDPTNLSKNLFENNLKRLLDERETQEQLRENLASLDHPEAAGKISDVAFQLAQGYAPSLR